MAKNNFHQIILQTWDGKTIDPSYVRFRGMKSIVINVASECGLTDESYRDIYEFATLMKDKVSIYLYPSNDFGGQEPGTMDQISNFCDKYGVLDLYPTVKLMPKVSVTDPDNDLFQFLQYNNHLADSGIDCKIQWNFQKFLIDTNGQLWGFSLPHEKLMGDKDIEDWCNNMEIMEE
jgi:glutathione peroxidase